MYIGPPQGLPPVGWGALDGREEETTRGGLTSASEIGSAQL